MPYAGVWVPTAYGSTHVVLAGPETAPPVVLLHGWNTNASGWWPQIQALAGLYRVVVPDTIGQAGRSSPTRPSTRGPAYADWLQQVLDALALRRPAFIGSSGGAWLTLKLAATEPERIGRAALLSPAGLAPIRLGFMLRYLAITCARPGQAAPARMARLISPPPMTLDEDHLRWQRALAGFRGQLPPPILPDAAIRRLEAPTLVLVGRYEVVFDPTAVAARAQRLLPHAWVEVVPHAGHDMTYDDPGWVNERLLRFLREGPPA